MWKYLNRNKRKTPLSLKLEKREKKGEGKSPETLIEEANVALEEDQTLEPRAEQQEVLTIDFQAEVVPEPLITETVTPSITKP